MAEVNDQLALWLITGVVMGMYILAVEIWRR